MQPNLKTFLVIAVMVVVALFAGLLYYLIYLNSGNQLFAIIFGGGILAVGGYAVVYLFGLADNAKKKGRAESAGTTADDATAADQSDTTIPDNLPQLLNNRAAIALLDGLRDAGLLDNNYQPAPNMQLCQKAYIAYSFCEILNTGQKWETFERFWQCSGLRQSYVNSCKATTVQVWRTEIYQTLVDVGSSNRLIFDTRSFTRSLYIQHHHSRVCRDCPMRPYFVSPTVCPG